MMADGSFVWSEKSETFECDNVLAFGYLALTILGWC